MNTQEAALRKITDSESYKKIVSLYPNINFENEVQQNLELSDYIRQACVNNANQVDNPRLKPDAPKLDEDFSKYFVINNLPKCDEAKAQRLIQLLIKLFQKKNVNIDPSNITMPFNEQGQTEGVAFVLASSEEQAKFAAAIMNDYQLDKNHLLSSCQINDFEKIMQTSDALEPGSAYSLIDLRDPLLDPKREQFLFQTGKDVHVKWHDTNTLHADQNVTDQQLQSDKPVQFSPKGTYLIVIKHDKVEFHGGKKMNPIITLPEPKVDYVSMSPCERYVLTYAPMSKSPYVVWNFQLVEQIRDFDQKLQENQYTYQWSYDGNYLAKKFKTEVTQTKDDGSTEVQKVKYGLSVYSLPSMELIANDEGQKKSITIEGIQEILWAPNRNVIIYTAFPGENQHPRVGFIEIPSRRSTVKTFANTQSFRLYFHPQGDYLAVMNEYKEKKTTKYSVELFDAKKQSFPHQQILIQREVIEFHSVAWEPYHSKIAIHTLAKRQIEAGKKDYTLDAQRNGVDIYEMLDDPIKGFITKTIGFLPSEKVTGFQWSGAGDIFNTFEVEGVRHSVSFYMISKETVNTAQTGVISAKKQTNAQKNKLISEEEKYEFKKTARHDIYETKYDSIWDQSGRYLALYGVKRSPLDKSDKSIRFYSIFGEPLGQFEKIHNLLQFKWRPRPNNTLNAKDMQKLRSEYQKKYLKGFKEEEKTEKKQFSNVVKEKKKHIRDEFLKNFLLPLRKEFEDQRDKYESLWPLKPKDMAEEPVEMEIIYSYDNVLSEKKIAS